MAEDGNLHQDEPEEKKLEMARFIGEHEDATAEELMNVAEEISRK